VKGPRLGVGEGEPGAAPGGVLRLGCLQLHPIDYENETAPNIGLPPYSKALVPNVRNGHIPAIWLEPERTAAFGPLRRPRAVTALGAFLTGHKWPEADCPLSGWKGTIAAVRSG